MGRPLQTVAIVRLCSRMYRMITPTAESAVKRSVTIRGDLDTQVESRVGPRGYSAYVNKALETQTRLDRLDEVIAAGIAEHGPVPAAIRDENVRDIAAAQARRR
jgi:hypothetical protein